MGMYIICITVDGKLNEAPWDTEIVCLCVCMNVCMYVYMYVCLYVTDSADCLLAFPLASSQQNLTCLMLYVQS